MGKLTALAARALSKPGRHGDGDGLYLNVAPSGSTAGLAPKRCIWVFTAEEMGRRSIGWDARKAAASDGTLVAPWILLPYPWLQVLGYGVEQGAHQPRLAAVHALQSVQPHVGCA